MSRRPNKVIPDTFTPIPSQRAHVDLHAVDAVADVAASGVVVHSDAEVPGDLGLSRDALRRAGFDAKVGDVLVLPGESASLPLAVGGGPLAEQSVDSLRDTAAAFARAAPRAGAVGLRLPVLGGVDARSAAQALTEGTLLARYRYSVLRAEPKETALTGVQLVLDVRPVAGGVVAG
ncbi:M17 family peptidase N-terminal domain-containing protein [Georgenia yuyongxinii]|uniref:Peptidase M17 leucyl aminopeptidase N-terminal domain-containing protein n=1 Tax=Georgenia yuyongxinii TaxID=2589797 RepID=A0A552WMV8_9MICO|nr:M17 family peptidase N-terminal domain-containing protein [Georgenia yuyongxinii]TRW44082.1 hypothetical protein FJ693_15055 [Georgenia yuyongxinii]